MSIKIPCPLLFASVTKIISESAVRKASGSIHEAYDSIVSDWIDEITLNGITPRSQILERVAKILESDLVLDTIDIDFAESFERV